MSTEWNGGKPQNIHDLKVYAQEHGSHFFDPDTMRFFGSRVAPGVAHGKSGVYFITSEQDKDGFGTLGYVWNGERRYTVRLMNSYADIASVGEMGAYPSLRAARAALKKYLAEEQS